MREACGSRRQQVSLPVSKSARRLPDGLAKRESGDQVATNLHALDVPRDVFAVMETGRVAGNAYMISACWFPIVAILNSVLASHPIISCNPPLGMSAPSIGNCPRDVFCRRKREVVLAIGWARSDASPRMDIPPKRREQAASHPGRRGRAHRPRHRYGYAPHHLSSTLNGSRAD